MKKRESISKIMSTELVTVNHSNNLIEVKNIFEQSKIRHLPVVNGKNIIGLISKTDFFRITYNAGSETAQAEINYAILNTMTIEQIMTKNLVFVSPEDTIHDVAKILTESEFHALPVVENGELKGIVTTTDILKYLLDQY